MLFFLSIEVHDLSLWRFKYAISSSWLLQLFTSYPPKLINQLTKTLYGKTELEHSLLNILFIFSLNIFYKILRKEFSASWNMIGFPKLKNLETQILSQNLENQFSDCKVRWKTDSLKFKKC